MWIEQRGGGGSGNIHVNSHRGRGESGEEYQISERSLLQCPDRPHITRRESLIDDFDKEN